MDKTASLTPTIKHIVIDKGTEPPHSGNYQQPSAEAGSFLCRRCGLALFRGECQFASHCGWPSFDDQIGNNIMEQTDADGQRTEIICQRCHAHLGHVFEGEQLTANNRRHCVNSLAIEFVADESVTDTNEVITAGGCFWGVEALFKQLPGVLKTEVGYTGGHQDNPTYQQVCHHQTGHVEAVRVVFDMDKTDTETVLKFFFEIHNPCQADGQGPDLGSQYLSKIFYYTPAQRAIAEGLIQILKDKGLDVTTECLPVDTFWPAEDFHQDYYNKTQHQPYCHRYSKRF